MYKGFNLVIKVCAKIQFRIRSRLSHPVGVASIVHEKIGSSFTWWLYIHTPNLNVHHVASPWTMDLCVLYVLRRHYYLNKWIYRLSHHRRWMCVIHVIVVLFYVTTSLVERQRPIVDMLCWLVCQIFSLFVIRKWKIYTYIIMQWNNIKKCVLNEKVFFSYNSFCFK